MKPLMLKKWRLIRCFNMVDKMSLEELLKLTGCGDIKHLRLCFVETGVLFTDPVTGEEDFRKYMENRND